MFSSEVSFFDDLETDPLLLAIPDLANASESMKTNWNISTF